MVIILLLATPTEDGIASGAGDRRADDSGQRDRGGVVHGVLSAINVACMITLVRCFPAKAFEPGRTGTGDPR